MFNCKEMAEKLLKIQEIKNKHPEKFQQSQEWEAGRKIIEQQMKESIPNHDLYDDHGFLKVSAPLSIWKGEDYKKIKLD